MRKNDTKTRTRPLTLKQLAAIAALLEGASMEGAAKEVHVSRATLYRWREQEAFRAELERGTRAAFDIAMGKLKLASRKAADKLSALLESDDEGIRRLAAKDLLVLALHSVEFDEFENRITALEAKIAGRIVIGAPYELSERFLPVVDRASSTSPEAGARPVKKSDASRRPDK